MKPFTVQGGIVQPEFVDPVTALKGPATAPLDIAGDGGMGSEGILIVMCIQQGQGCPMALMGILTELGHQMRHSRVLTISHLPGKRGDSSASLERYFRAVPQCQRDRVFGDACGNGHILHGNPFHGLERNITVK